MDAPTRYRYTSLIPAVLAWVLIISLLAPENLPAQQGEVNAEAEPTQNGSRQSNRPANQQGESVIRGRVLYSDSNRPLRRAEVLLFDPEAGTRGGHAGTVSTDRRGVFTFEKVPAGRYLILVEAPSIISAHALLGKGDSLLTKIMLGEIKDGFSEITVDGKGRIETEVRVRRGGVITGRVTADDDEPVSRADVKLFRRERGRFIQVESTWQLLDREKRALQTDSRGIYRISGLPPGEYVVRVSEAQIDTDHMGNEQEAYGNGSLVIAYYPSATNLKDAEVVKVLEGSESAGIDVRLPARETHKIGGTVIVSQEGEPAGFVEIKVDRADEPLPQPSLTDWTTRTDRDGKWEVYGIPDGEYIVTVGAGIGARVGSAESGGWVKVAPRRFTVKVAGTDVTGLETRLAAGASLSGKVTVEGGKSLSYNSLWVEIIPAAGNNKTQFPQNDKAPAERDNEVVDRTYVQDEAGTFEIDGIPAGRYYFKLRGIEGDRYYVKALMRGAVDMMRSPFKIDEGQNLTGIQVILATDVATIEGRAATTAATGKPPSHGTVVILMPIDSASRRFIEGLIVTRADNLGWFTLKAPPGEYFITALTRQQNVKQPEKINEDSLMRERAKFRRITLRPGERVKIEDLTLMNF